MTRGVGDAERVAERAVLSVTFSVVTEDRVVAVDRLAVLTKDVDRLLDGFEVEVRERRLNVAPSWEDGNRVGWQAQQSHRIRVDRLGELPALVTALVAVGPITLNAPDWELIDDRDAVREAQTVAVTNARCRAEGYAEALGKRLGVLLSVADSGSGREFAVARTVGYGAAESPRPAELNLAPLPVTVTAECVTRWSLLD
jgi:uncharacterized protein YggE